MGYGTFRIPADVVKQAMKEAIEIGYQYIDTTAVYGNEEAVGRGIKDSGIKCEDLFVTSKLWNTNRGYEQAGKAFQETLGRLQMGYLNLYLIHWPANEKQSGDDAARINAETWRVMEDLYNEGKTRAIGASNSTPHHTAELMKTAKIAPAVDQIEVHPDRPHTEEIKYLQAYNTLVEAWASLGGQGAKVLTNLTMIQIADKYQKIPAQVCLRWILQQGIPPLPKLVHKGRMISNQNMLDFESTDEDTRKTDLLPNLGGQCADPDEVDF